MAAMTETRSTSRVVPEAVWQSRRAAHHTRVDEWLVGHRQRKQTGEAHPVEDFLFEYYSYRPHLLRRWHPGHGVVLAGPSADEFLDLRDYHRVAAGVALDGDAVLASRGRTVLFVRDLMRRTLDRPAQFGCFGMHEWAMVFGVAPEETRHPDWPLRFSPERIAAIVEEREVRCTHFDAFRFFTPAARPLNLVQPTRADQLDLEQSGCLHAGMDVYKFCAKLSPLVPSDLVADAFGLAREIRELDMAASPYDLTALGLAPVQVETPEGRREYVAAQRRFAVRADELRRRLLCVLEPLTDRVPADLRHPVAQVHDQAAADQGGQTTDAGSQEGCRPGDQGGQQQSAGTQDATDQHQDAERVQPGEARSRG